MNVEPDHFTSDHYPVTVIFHVSNSESITSDFPNDIPIYSKNTFNIDVFMNSLVIFDCLFQVYFQMIPTDFYLAWYDAMIKSVQTSICLKRKKKSMLPFCFSSHSVHLSNKVSTEKRKLAKLNLLYSTLLSDLQRDLNNSIVLDKITLLSSFHSLDTNDCFKLLHKLSGSTPIPSVVKLGASCTSTDNTKANLFNIFFCSVYKSETFTYNVCSDNISINLRELSFGESDVNSLLKKVPDTTAVAADGTPPFVLKYNADALTPMVYLLFSQIVTCCIWPDFWKEAFIMPFHKSGPKSDITNYREISILPRLSLCLEKLLFNFIYSNVRHKLSRRQHGFVKKRSTLEYVENIYKCIDANEKFCSVYFDIQKAFDSVSNKQLLNKLSSFSFDKNFIMLISSYLSNGSQRVRINNILSYKGYISTGVPQGSILGPFLFLIYINDLPDVVKYSSPSLFDLKLLYRDNYHDNFQSDLDSVENWVTQNDLDFHPDKTKFITNNSFIFNLYLNGSEICSVDHIKDLGIYISPTLSWNHHVSAKLGKATKCFHYLKRTDPFNSPVKTKLQLYISCVRSILLYNSCIWYPNLSKLRDLDKFQRRQ